MPVKTVTHPETGQQFKLGRNAPVLPGVRTPLRRMMLDKVLPQVVVPTHTNYSPPAAKSLHNIYCNDQLGCCVISGGFHVRGLSSFNSDAPDAIFSDNQVIHDYGAIGGYNPNDPWTDQGCDENTALNYWQKTGFPDGSKLVNYVSVDATSEKEIKLAMYLFENLFFGIGLPDAWVNPFPKTSGFKWDVEGPSDQNNGHAFVGCDLIPGAVKISTWGMTGFITYPAMAYYASPTRGGQLFTLLTPDIISKVSQKSPAGYDISTLNNYLRSLPSA